MKSARISLLLALSYATPVWANNPPAPQMALAEIAILPLMMILTAAGGGYAILRTRRRANLATRVFKIVAVIVLILFSASHEGYGFLLLTLFALIAVFRAVKMMVWAVKPPQIAAVRISPKRLASAGGVLLLLALFLGGFAPAFIGQWSRSKSSSARDVAVFRRYAAFQMALKSPAFPQISKDRDRYEAELRAALSGYRNDAERLQLEQQPGGRFSAYLLPFLPLPFFPYNYLTSAPSYYASEKGEIRMVRVHYSNDRCPPDAPIVDRVIAQDFQELEQGKTFPAFH